MSDVVRVLFVRHQGWLPSIKNIFKRKRNVFCIIDNLKPLTTIAEQCSAEMHFLSNCFLLLFQGPMPHKVVLQANDSGFFSFFTAFVSYIVWELTADPEAVVLPDWRISKLLERYNHQLKNFVMVKLKMAIYGLNFLNPCLFPGIDPTVYNSESAL